MIAISIVYKREDIFRVQQKYFRKYMGLEILSASVEEGMADADIRLQCRWKTRSEAFIESVGQLIEKYHPSEDLFIVEGDIFPIRPVDVSTWPNLVMRRWGGYPYPGIFYLRRTGNVRPFWKDLGPESVPGMLLKIEHDLQADNAHFLDWEPYECGLEQFGIGDENTRPELIGGIFLHVNGADRNLRRRRPDHCPYQRGCCGEEKICQISSAPCNSKPDLCSIFP